MSIRRKRDGTPLVRIGGAWVPMQAVVYRDPRSCFRFWLVCAQDRPLPYCQMTGEARSQQAAARQVRAVLARWTERTAKAAVNRDWLELDDDDDAVAELARWRPPVCRRDRTRA